jgi:hypothetical protein
MPPPRARPQQSMQKLTVRDLAYWLSCKLLVRLEVVERPCLSLPRSSSLMTVMLPFSPHRQRRRRSVGSTWMLLTRDSAGSSFFQTTPPPVPASPTFLEKLIITRH